MIVGGGGHPVSNLLVKKFPEIAAMWHPTKNDEIRLSDITCGSSRKVWWLCPISNGEYHRSIREQVRVGTQSPFTTNKRVLAGFNDLKSQAPDSAALWHPTKNGKLVPESIVVGSNKKVWWKCPVSGKDYSRRVSHQVSAGSGTPFFGNGKVVPGFNDLATTHSDISAMWHPEKNGTLKPSEITAKSEDIVWWICPVSGGDYQRSVRGQVRSGATSVFTSKNNALTLSGFNDIATTHPDIAALWHPTKNGDLTPEMVTSGSGKMVWWRCSVSGADYQRIIQDQVKSGTVSPTDFNKIVVAGINDLATTHPEAAQAWHPTKNGDITPEMITSGNSYKAWWVCSKTEVEFSRRVRDATRRPTGILYSPPASSLAELQVSDFISSLVGSENIVTNDRSIIAPLELDVVVPDKRIAVEFNGLYWHSETVGKDRNYHKNKTNRCRGAGYQLITIWEDDWYNRRSVVESMLAHKLGCSQLPHVPARKCNVYPVDSDVARSFLEDHHIQGGVSSSVCLGLFTDLALLGEDSEEAADDVVDLQQNLVGVITFRVQDTTATLSRFATSAVVPGGFTKLLKHAEPVLRENGCTEIVAFSDHQVSNGGLYRSTGFTVDEELAPDYSYSYKQIRYHKSTFRTKRFRDDPKLQYQDGLTETELAQLNNVHRVWDSGRTRWIKDL